MLAAGEYHLLTPSAMHQCTISEMLSKFSVGTENRKNTTVGAPDPSLVGAIIDLPNKMLVSTEQAVILRMNRGGNKQVKKCEYSLFSLNYFFSCHIFISHHIFISRHI